MKRLSVGAVLSAAAVLFISTGTTASATDLFSQGWGSGSYHASTDFVPSGTVKIGTKCGGGGSARYSYSSLVKTSGSSRVFSSYSYPCDGARHNDGRTATSSSGVSYYLRWYGQDSYLNNGYSAPSAAVYAYR